jgi:hypothetical protein
VACLACGSVSVPCVETNQKLLSCCPSLGSATSYGIHPVIVRYWSRPVPQPMELRSAVHQGLTVQRTDAAQEVSKGNKAGRSLAGSILMGFSNHLAQASGNITARVLERLPPKAGSMHGRISAPTFSSNGSRQRVTERAPTSTSRLVKASEPEAARKEDHSSSAPPAGTSLICLRPSLISNSSPGSRSSMAV